MIPKALRDEIMQRASRGEAVNDIAAAVGKQRSTVLRWAKRAPSPKKLAALAKARKALAAKRAGNCNDATIAKWTALGALADISQRTGVSVDTIRGFCRTLESA